MISGVRAEREERVDDRADLSHRTSHFLPNPSSRHITEFAALYLQLFNPIIMNILVINVINYKKKTF